MREVVVHVFISCFVFVIFRPYQAQTFLRGAKIMRKLEDDDDDSHSWKLISYAATVPQTLLWQQSYA